VPVNPTAADVEAYLAQGRQLLRDIQTAYAADPATQIANAQTAINGKIKAAKDQLDSQILSLNSSLAALTDRITALEDKVGL
jgi:hypothetical protein